jgi:hypothetical protein
MKRKSYCADLTVLNGGQCGTDYRRCRFMQHGLGRLTVIVLDMVNNDV